MAKGRSNPRATDVDPREQFVALIMQRTPEARQIAKDILLEHGVMRTGRVASVRSVQDTFSGPAYQIQIERPSDDQRDPERFWTVTQSPPRVGALIDFTVTDGYPPTGKSAFAPKQQLHLQTGILDDIPWPESVVRKWVAQWWLEPRSNPTRKRQSVPLVDEGRRRRVLDRYEEAIMFGMARYLWVYAFAQFIAPALDEDVNVAAATHRSYRVQTFRDSVQAVEDGQTFDDATPDAPEGAYTAALDLAKLLAMTPLGVIVRKQGELQIYSDHPMTQLFQLFMEVATGQGYELDPVTGGVMWPDVFDSEPEEGLAGHRLAHRFGSGMAAASIQADGAGCIPCHGGCPCGETHAVPGVWFDNFARPADWNTPTFRVWFDGKWLTWEGGGVQGQGAKPYVPWRE